MMLNKQYTKTTGEKTEHSMKKFSTANLDCKIKSTPNEQYSHPKNCKNDEIPTRIAQQHQLRKASNS